MVVDRSERFLSIVIRKIYSKSIVCACMTVDNGSESKPKIWSFLVCNSLKVSILQLVEEYNIPIVKP